MGNIVGEPFEVYVVDQINQRQKKHGSVTRSNEDLIYLNSRNAWVKLASGTSISKEKLKELGVPSSIFPGNFLAKEYVLFNGTSKFTQKRDTSSGTTSIPYIPGGNYGLRSGIGANGAYSTWDDDFGYIPMPGIEGVEVKALNRGSTKRATIKIKCWSRKQLDILDVLYLRLGYTVLLEWGDSHYLTPSGNVELVRNTVTEDAFFLDKNTSQNAILGKLEEYREKYNGCTDGMIGRVVNFNWEFKSDGSYDITLELVSLGDVIESLKLNISPTANLQTFINSKIIGLNNTAIENEEENEVEVEDPISEGRGKSIIHFHLFLFRLLDNNIGDVTTQDVFIKSVSGTEGEGNNVGRIVDQKYRDKATSSTFTSTLKVQIGSQGGNGTNWRDYTDESLPNIVEIEVLEGDDETLERLKDEKIKEIAPKYRPTVKTTDLKTLKRYIKLVEIKRSSKEVDELELLPHGRACFVAKCENKIDGYYLNFGYLCNFLNQKVTPIIKSQNSEESILRIDADTETNLMYAHKNTISLDPRVCVVRNDGFLYHGDGQEYQTLTNLSPFRYFNTGDTIITQGRIFNLYLNFKFIIQTLDDNTDEEGNINYYDFLRGICVGLNKALGGVNNLEPIIDETENVIKIIDSTPHDELPKPKDSYKLDLYGYTSGGGGESNFIRNFQLKTEITKEYASMVTIGATANGYTKGMEATALSKLNKGIVDRYQIEIQPSNESSQLNSPSSSASGSTEDEALTNYKNYTTQKGGFLFWGNKTENLTPIIFDPERIDTNLSNVTEYYRYQNYKATLSSDDSNGGVSSLGFIPFKVNITMDGLSGIKIYNKVELDTKFLPSRYGESLNFIITKVDHSLKNNDWETKLETMVIPKTSNTDLDKFNTLITEIEADGITEVYGNGESSSSPIQRDPNLTSTGTTPSDQMNNPDAYKFASDINTAIKKGLNQI